MKIGAATKSTQRLAALFALAALAGQAGATEVAASSAQDARIRKVIYSPDAVVTIQTKRGQVTHIVLAPDEQIVGEPATGQGSDCRVETSTWCVVATEGRDLFVKPRTGATTNNVIVVSTKRRHAFELVAVDKGPAAMRVAIVLPPPPPPPAPPPGPFIPTVTVPPPLSAEQLLANRLRAAPLVRNAEYSVAVGSSSEDIVPTMVWDDGRFTYFGFPGNRPIPAVFQTTPDGSEEMVNVRMNDEAQLVADRVARRFLLRLGNSVVAVINEAFDATGSGAQDGTSVPGVSRVLRASAAPQSGEKQ